MTDTDDKKKPGKNERLAGYSAKLRALKERNSLREVTERELLLEFININRSRINEFPMLKTQQNSVINLLCLRSVDHPGHEYIAKLISNFITVLTRYSKAAELGQADQAAKYEHRLLNSETLLIKCVQGAVYASALTADNFEEVLIRFFGADAIQRYNNLLESTEMNEVFWKALINLFITAQVEETYQSLVDAEQFTLNKENSLLIIRYNFDNILAHLKHTAQEIQKTRVQSYFEKNFTDPEYKDAQRCVLEHITGFRNFIAPGGNDADVLYITRITCIDNVAVDYKDQVVKRGKSQGAPTQEEEDQFDFLKQQVLAGAVGAAIAVDIVREDFIRASTTFRPKEVEAIRNMVHYFDMGSLNRLLLYLLESHFVHLLMQKADGEGAKVRIRSIRRRRTPAKIVEAMAKAGMSKIRRHKIWEPDPGNSAMLLFKPRTLKELSGYAQVLQIEPPLAAKLKQAWDQSPYKVDILVILDLALIARTTTNLKVKLGEILSKFDVGAPKKTQPAQTADTGEAGGEPDSGANAPGAPLGQQNAG